MAYSLSSGRFVSVVETSLDQESNTRKTLITFWYSWSIEASKKYN